MMMERYIRVDQKKGEPQVIQENEVRFALLPCFRYCPELQFCRFVADG